MITTQKQTRRKTGAGVTEFDGIRHIKKRAFLAAFAEVGVITHAAEIAKVNRDCHYNWLAADEDGSYAAAVAVAEEQAIQRMEQEARRRAVEGVAEPHYWKDQMVGTVQKYSDLLLIFLLKSKRPGIYRDTMAVEHSGSTSNPEMAALVALAIQAVADARRVPAIEASYVDAEVVKQEGQA